MTKDRYTAIIVGVLFIIATAFLYIGGAVYNPILESSDYLNIAYPNKTVVIIGMLLEFACVLAIPLIAVFIFPVLKRHNEALALGYIGFRFFEAVLFAIVEINKLSLINVSQGYLREGGMSSTFFQNMGSSIQSVNEWTFTIYVIIFGVGALLLYSVLYRSKLVPRFISVWGYIAAIVILIGAVLGMVELGTETSGLGWQTFSYIPIAVNEMVLAIWLIVKGFKPPAIASQSTK